MPEIPKIPVGEAASQAFGWLQARFAPAFDALAAVLQAMIDGMLRGLTAPHPLIVVATLAARALAAGRELTGPEPLYLRAPDVTLPAASKRVGA